jgi:hypothetical protein
MPIRRVAMGVIVLCRVEQNYVCVNGTTTTPSVCSLEDTAQYEIDLNFQGSKQK